MFEGLLFYVKKQQQIDFFVKDTSYGISTEDQTLIFDRFKRIDNDYTTKSSGLGLDLSINKAYLNMMHGSICLTSSIGKGSQFYFSIPLELATKKAKTRKPFYQLLQKLLLANAY